MTNWNDGTIHGADVLQAADRIELLATTNEQLVATNEALSISNATLIAERDQWIAHAKNAIWSDSEQLRLTEAKLAECEARLGKVVEAAEEMSAAFYSDGNVTERHLRACNAGVKLHATLAELKGESHE